MSKTPDTRINTLARGSFLADNYRPRKHSIAIYINPELVLHLAAKVLLGVSLGRQFLIRGTDF